jgi:hypothetical protein
VLTLSKNANDPRVRAAFPLGRWLNPPMAFEVGKSPEHYRATLAAALHKLGDRWRETRMHDGRVELGRVQEDHKQANLTVRQSGKLDGTTQLLFERGRLSGKHARPDSAIRTFPPRSGSGQRSGVGCANRL